MDKTVSEHVHRGLALLQHNVPDEWLKLPVFRVHVHEDHLTENRLKALDADTHRTAHDAGDGCLGRQFHLHSADFLQIT